MSEKNKHSQSKEINNQFEAVLEKAASVDEKYGISVSSSETTAAFQYVSQQAGLASTSSTPRISVWKYAAAVLVLLTALGLGYLVIPNQVTVPYGETQTITLADHTTITLNSGSSLSYPKWFNMWERTVSLNGEAFFEVTKNGQPFRVEAGRGMITVMGTQFNVRSWNTGEATTSVFLKEGRVSFAPLNHSSQKVILDPGEFSKLTANLKTPTSPRSTDTSKATAWMHRGLAFEDQPLSAIFNELSRRFDIKIKTDSQTLLQETLTIYISEVNNADQTLSDICRAKGLTYTRSGDTYVVSESL